MILNIILTFLGAYLLGSIPSAVWIGKIFYGKDVREFGSKNAGATNTFRVLGTRAGIPVMLLDVAKGFIATSFVHFLPFLSPGTDIYVSIQIGLGIVAVLGHIFPVFASFRGGKGIATLLGMVLAIQLTSGLICLGIFVLVLTISQYVSLSSITASIFYPVLIILIFGSPILSLKIFSLVVTLLVLYTHRENIKRLFAGKENRVYFLRKNPNKI